MWGPYRSGVQPNKVICLAHSYVYVCVCVGGFFCVWVGVSVPMRVVVWVNVCLSLRSTGLVEALHVPVSYPVQSTESSMRTITTTRTNKIT